MNLRLYHIDKDYLNYLKYFDHRVRNNSGDDLGENLSKSKNPNQNPNITGTVFSINDKLYFAPLTPPKEKHFKLKNSDLTTFKLLHRKLFIGSVLLNNMIPVKDELIAEVDIRVEDDPRYQALLQKQYRAISNNISVIVNRAQSLYSQIIDYKNLTLASLCCDFAKLEQACDNYQLNHQKQI